MSSKKYITITFNLLLFIYLFIVCLTNTLFDPNFNAEVPWDKVYESSPIFAIIFALLIGLVLIFCGAVFIKTFWNRFLVDVFKLRMITLNEAVTITLLLSILFL